MRVFKKSGRQLGHEAVQRQKYAIFFSSEKLLKGLVLTVLGWVVTGASLVVFQDLVIHTSIFVVMFVIFSVAFIPLFTAALFRGKSFFVCDKKKLVLLRAFLAVAGYFIYCSATVWMTNKGNSLLFSIDTFLVPLGVYLVFKKRLSSLTWLGIISSFLGLALVYSFKLEFNFLEMGICFISCMVMAALIFVSCYIFRFDPPLRQAMYTTLFGVIASGIMVLITGWDTPSQTDLIYMVIQGLIYAATVMMFITACDSMEPHVISVLTNIFPIVLILLKTWLCGYSPGWTSLVGSIITTAGIAIVIMGVRYRKREEDLLLG